MFLYDLSNSVLIFAWTECSDLKHLTQAKLKKNTHDNVGAIAAFTGNAPFSGSGWERKISGSQTEHHLPQSDFAVCQLRGHFLHRGVRIFAIAWLRHSWSMCLRILRAVYTYQGYLDIPHHGYRNAYWSMKAVQIFATREDCINVTPQDAPLERSQPLPNIQCDLIEPTPGISNQCAKQSYWTQVYINAKFLMSFLQANVIKAFQYPSISVGGLTTVGGEEMTCRNPCRNLWRGASTS